MGKVTTVSATALPCARRGDVRSGFEGGVTRGGGYTVMDQIPTREE